MHFFLLLLSALKTAFLMTVGFLWHMLLAPIRTFRPQPGRSTLPPPPDVAADIQAAVRAAPRPAASVPQPAQSPVQAQALDILARAAARLKPNIKGPQTRSAQLSREVHAWLESLSTTELRRLIAARVAGIAAHLASGTAIAGVRPLKTPPQVAANDSTPAEVDDHEETQAWRIG